MKPTPPDPSDNADTDTSAHGAHTMQDPGASRGSWLLVFIVAVCVVLPFFLTALIEPRYSPDSWAYYELGRSVFEDFYRFFHFRSYSGTSAYSSSFPPLFPVLIAVFEYAFNTGARTGMYLAFSAFLIFALVSEKIGHLALGARWVGLSVALVLLFDPALALGEMTAGRTIPLQLLIFALILLILLKHRRPTLLHMLALGGLAGIAVLNRFDAILLPILLTLTLWWMTRRPVRAMAVLGASVIVVSPWILYSFATFGTLFATDNSGIATSLDANAFVTDWWPVAQPTIRDDPMAWGLRVLGNTLGLAKALTLVLTSRMSLVFGFAVFLIAVLQFRSMQDRERTGGVMGDTRILQVLAIAVAISALLLAPQALTGYFSVRYFSILIWTIFTFVAVLVISKHGSLQQRLFLSRVFSITLLASISLYSATHFAKALQQGQLDFGQWPEFEAAREVHLLKDCLGPDQTARVLVLGSNTFAARAGAQGDLYTMMEPRNMFDGRLDADGQQAFVDVWDVSYVLAVTPARSKLALKTFDLRPVSDCPLELFKIVP